ncbi:ParB/RepB/Spo0J family partition protein [Acinetobacter sp.]|uniref:ParB/RepB/Spo0J family partition protein n=1 Tax=Acinetobacter sp. TaxID=472 RepID=UPI002FDAA6A0
MQEIGNIKLIPINKINIANPRARGRKQHNEIVESIKKSGLKKPITVRVRTDQSNDLEYDLVCGQGRVEAFKILKQEYIWACILEVSEDQGMVMSLVENIARHNRSSIEQLHEIKALKERGYSNKQIAERIATTENWVNIVLALLERGESRLLTAVDSGVIPIDLAVSISRSSTVEIQNLLTEALEKKEIKGSQISTIRNILDKRERGFKNQPSNNVFGRNPIRPNKISLEDLKKICDEDMIEFELISKKSQLVQDNLIFIQEAFKKLIAIPAFRDLLIQQGINKFPETLQHLIDFGLTYEDK